MTQIVVQIDEELARRVDRLIEEGIVASRSEAVRTALRSLVSLAEAEQRRSNETDEALVEAYRRHPETERELAAAAEMARLMIAAEPW